jgi:hypothetical protein
VSSVCIGLNLVTKGQSCRNSSCDNKLPGRSRGAMLASRLGQRSQHGGGVAAAVHHAIVKTSYLNATKA